ncbi:tyrosine--tRNA ligase [Candidatus Parcubacteria bacterium]|nr:tyrosine--tRNA ligase [Patescibacteria group bacterium]MBU4481950.1 tyrosine--tRNA ligase [Patescibacteria group bacterium]MCG2687044.1 tyrosine--tRNA ligase [Candidatus Parcubacteria bacterium]
MNILEDLKYRGLIYQMTDEKDLSRRLEQGQIVLYCGFDPSADSLHLGNLLQILILKRFQDAGNKPIGLVGGGTGLIGDPSGKSEERKLNSEKVVQAWSKKVNKQLERFLDFKAKNKAEIVNNYDWLHKIEVIEYLRDIGKNFSINEMLAKESVKSRLEKGISFTEFNYMILQAIDFLELYKNYDCELQIGGSDQWGNITAGADLVRKVLNKKAFALTAPLITKSDGTKFGKTESGTIWLDAEKTSPYEFYQFWINTSDTDVIKFIKAFTFLNKNEIEKLEQEVKNNPEKREAHKILAYEVTKLVHGESVAKIEKVNSEAWFSKNIKDFTEEELEISFKKVESCKINGKKMDLVDLLVFVKVTSSKRQAREDITNGAIYLNGERCKDLNKLVDKKDFLYHKYLIARKGKKKYFLIKW